MSNDTVILSPEFAGDTGRREALATVTTIQTGAFVKFAAGGFVIAVAADAANMIATENIAAAEDLDYVYAIGENVFAAALPGGTLVNVKAIAATYAAGDEVEIGINGNVVAQSAGVTVGVVPSFAGKTVGAGESLIIQLA